MQPLYEGESVGRLKLIYIQGVRKKTVPTNSLLSRKIIYALHYIIVNISMEYVKSVIVVVVNVCFEIYFTNGRIII